MEEIIEKYIKDKRDSWSGDTEKTFRGRLKIFVGWCHKNNLSLKDLTPSHLSMWQSQMMEAGRSVSSIRALLKMVIRVLQWADTDVFPPGKKKVIKLVEKQPLAPKEPLANKA